MMVEEYLTLVQYVYRKPGDPDSIKGHKAGDYTGLSQINQEKKFLEM